MSFLVNFDIFSYFQTTFTYSRCGLLFTVIVIIKPGTNFTTDGAISNLNTAVSSASLSQGPSQNNL